MRPGMSAQGICDWRGCLCIGILACPKANERRAASGAELIITSEGKALITSPCTSLNPEQGGLKLDADAGLILHAD